MFALRVSTYNLDFICKIGQYVTVCVYHFELVARWLINYAARCQWIFMHSV